MEPRTQMSLDRIPPKTRSRLLAAYLAQSYAEFVGLSMVTYAICDSDTPSLTEIIVPGISVTFAATRVLLLVLRIEECSDPVDGAHPLYAGDEHGERAWLLLSMSGVATLLCGVEALFLPRRLPIQDLLIPAVAAVLNLATCLLILWVLRRRGAFAAPAARDEEDPATRAEPPAGPASGGPRAPYIGLGEGPGARRAESEAPPSPTGGVPEPVAQAAAPEEPATGPACVGPPLLGASAAAEGGARHGATSPRPPQPVGHSEF